MLFQDFKRTPTLATTGGPQSLAQNGSWAECLAMWMLDQRLLAEVRCRSSGASLLHSSEQAQVRGETNLNHLEESYVLKQQHTHT